jgi:GNAT superfamily N-acetyltransferase
MEKLEFDDNKIKEIDEELTIPIGEAEFPVRFQLKKDGYFGLGNEEEQYGIGGKFINDQAIITHLIVREDLRKQNIGHSLLTELENKLKEAGLSKVYAKFRNMETIRFLEHEGYQSVEASSEDYRSLMDKSELNSEVVTRLLSKTLN